MRCQWLPRPRKAGSNFSPAEPRHEFFGVLGETEDPLPGVVFDDRMTARA
jgi:hypothetical protein